MIVGHIGGGASAPQIKNSVRFRRPASPSFSRNITTSSNRRTFTISFFVKRAVFGVLQNLFWAWNGGNTTSFGISFTASDTIQIASNQEGVSTNYNLTTVEVFRDPFAWLQIVVAMDTTQAVASDRLKIWVDRVPVLDLSSSAYPPLNFENPWNNSSYLQTIGQNSAPELYLSEVHVIDGLALTPDYFTSAKPNNQKGCIYKPYSGTYGINGSYLSFQDGSGNSKNLATVSNVSAPNGGVASSTIVSDGTYLVTNTSTGSAFTALQWDFGQPTDFTKIFLGGAYFTNNASSTAAIDASNDGISWTQVATTGITNTGTNYTVFFSTRARYLRLRMISFGVNGQFTIDAAQPQVDSLGRDFSGNGNNWRVNNISLTAGADYDWLLDTPTNNYAVLNPLMPILNGATFTDANLRVFSPTSLQGGGVASMPVNGKVYAEFSPTNIFSDANSRIGLSTETGAMYRAYGAGGEYYNGASWEAYGAAYAAPNIIGVEVDTIEGTLEFFKNNVSQGKKTGLSLLGLFLSPVCYINGGQSSWYANFGQRPFSYPVRTGGFKPLCSENVPLYTGAAAEPWKHFDAPLWLGDGVNNRNISLPFTPGFVWPKARSAAYDALVFDSSRGAGKSLTPSSTAAEINLGANGYVSAFTANGFTLSQGSSSLVSVNESGRSYVAWAFKAGGAPVLNNAGSIPALVSANIAGGFSVVTYSGTLSNTGFVTIAHGLGKSRVFSISKSLNPNGADSGIWFVQHPATAVNKFLRLNSADALIDTVSTGGGNLPQATVDAISRTYNSGGAVTGNNYVAFCWAEIPGFSKFGSYIGNASTNGQFVYLGFKPRLLLLKNASDGTATWILWDSSRDTYNVVRKQLYPNQSAAESVDAVNNVVDFVSNGFKVRGASSVTNGSGHTILYAAFA